MEISAIETTLRRYAQELRTVILDDIKIAISLALQPLPSLTSDVILEQPLAQKPAGSAKPARRKLPVQFCPVPRCTGKAAPIFGMVCSKHKDVPKDKIKLFRDARRLKKTAV